MQVIIKRNETQAVISELVMTMMGVDRFAYVKPVALVGDEMEYAVYAADGTRLATFDSMDDAFYSVECHNLTPVKLH